MNHEMVMAKIKMHASLDKAAILGRFFKTGPGQYAAGDVFVGVMVPVSRKIAHDFRELPLAECEKLLASPIHEARLIALIILCDQFKRGDERERAAIYKIYLAHTDRINNWDLVDTSAPNIVGAYLLERSWQPLTKLSHSKSLWERRIAIVSTFAHIRANNFEPTLTIAELLLNDSHDLIHKACGWMLREVGKRSDTALKNFLDTYKSRMPRTMLRYAIEKFDTKTRESYLKK
jgi:3-methyladenine DNA glycosylase AlkD